jgi:protein-disulfide isomerase
MRISRVLMLAGPLLLAGLASAAVDEQRLVKYYRKKANLSPAQKVSVSGLHASAIKGVQEGTLEIGDPPNTRQIPFALSADGRYAMFGQIEDLAVDPAKAVMEKISLKGEPSKGPANAKVTIVEYSDFQCPFCARGYSTLENQVLKEYGDKVRFVYKHYPLPFHPWAEAGAVAAECAKEQKPEAFWKVYSGLFENQQQVTPDNLKEKVTGMLADTGIDMAKFNDCFDNKKTLPKVKAQMQEGNTVGVNGTPAFIINGRLVSGAQPFENFKNIIDDELASAK